jgi:hypothetical protein
MSIQEVMLKNLEEIKASSPSFEKKDDIVENNVEEKESKDINLDNKSNKNEDISKDIKKDKHSFQQRLNSKHAEAMRYKEEAEKQKSLNDELSKRLSALEGTISNKQIEDQPKRKSLESIEDLEEYLSTVATKEEIEQTVAKILDERLFKAKENIEKEAKEKTFKQLQDEFTSILYKHYNPDNDVDFEIDDDIRAEALDIVEVFNSNPQKFLPIIKKHGVNYIKKFLKGEFEIENKANTLKNIIDKADSIRNNNSSEKAQPFDNKDKQIKGIKNILENAMNTIKKKGA